MDIVTIDFETFYDKDYSLSRITTEEYVRSDLFETIGVSVKVNEDPGCWYSGNKSVHISHLVSPQFAWKAASRAAILIFFICIIAARARPAAALSSSLSRRGRISGMICQDRP